MALQVGLTKKAILEGGWGLSNEDRAQLITDQAKLIKTGQQLTAYWKWVAKTLDKPQYWLLPSSRRGQGIAAGIKANLDTFGLGKNVPTQLHAIFNENPLLQALLLSVALPATTKDKWTYTPPKNWAEIVHKKYPWFNSLSPVLVGKLYRGYGGDPAPSVISNLKKLGLMSEASTLHYLKSLLDRDYLPVNTNDINYDVRESNAVIKTIDNYCISSEKLGKKITNVYALIAPLEAGRHLPKDQKAANRIIIRNIIAYMKVSKNKATAIKSSALKELFNAFKAELKTADKAPPFTDVQLAHVGMLAYVSGESDKEKQAFYSGPVGKKVKQATKDFIVINMKHGITAYRNINFNDAGFVSALAKNKTIAFYLKDKWPWNSFSISRDMDVSVGDWNRRFKAKVKSSVSGTRPYEHLKEIRVTESKVDGYMETGDETNPYWKHFDEKGATGLMRSGMSLLRYDDEKEILVPETFRFKKDDVIYFYDSKLDIHCEKPAQIKEYFTLVQKHGLDTPALKEALKKSKVLDFGGGYSHW